MRKYLLFAVLSFCLWGGVKGQTNSVQVINGTNDFSIDTLSNWVSVSGSNWFELYSYLIGGEGISYQGAFQIEEAAFVPQGGVLIDSVAYMAFPNGIDTVNQVWIFTGVSNPSFFSANPEGIDISGKYNVVTNTRLVSNNSNEVDLLFFNTVTDAPAIDIRPQGSSIPLVNDLSYREGSNYVSLPANSYVVEITNSDQTQVLGSFTLDLQSFAGQALFVMLRGFINPANNPGGDSLGLCYINPAGTVGCFDDFVVGMPETILPKLEVFPNPATDFITVRMEGLSNLSLFNLMGTRVWSWEGNRLTSSIEEVKVPVSQLSQGTYLLKVQGQSGETFKRISVIY